MGQGLLWSTAQVGGIVDAKCVKSSVKVPRAAPQWFTGIWLGKDTEADKSIVGTAEGVFLGLRFGNQHLLLGFGNQYLLLEFKV